MMADIIFLYAPIITVGAMTGLAFDSVAAVLTVQTVFAVMAVLGAGLGGLFSRRNGGEA